MNSLQYEILSKNHYHLLNQLENEIIRILRSNPSNNFCSFEILGQINNLLKNQLNRISNRFNKKLNSQSFIGSIASVLHKTQRISFYGYKKDPNTLTKRKAWTI